MNSSPSLTVARTGGNDLKDHINGTYFGLRMGLIVVGFSLPIVLIVAGLIIQPGVGIRSSLSDYYNSPGRDVFVGSLIAIGAILVAYKGFTPAEDRAYDLAGMFAIVTALVPTGRWVHGTAAIALFLCVGYVSWFRAGDTLSLIEDDGLRRRYERMYKGLGILMVVLPLAAAALTWTLSLPIVVLVVEVVAVWLLGIFWASKSLEYARTQAEERAAAGNLAVVHEDRAEASEGAGKLRRMLGRPFDDRSVVDMSRVGY